MQLHHSIDRIHRAGAELVVVGNGAPRFITGFRELTGYQGPLYTDPSLASYRAASLKRGLGTFLSTKVLTNALRALTRGHLQGRTRGDPAQQGGTLVILPSGQVVFHHVSQVAGDNAEPKDIVAALEAATSPR